MKTLLLAAVLALPALPSLAEPPPITPIGWIVQSRHNIDVDDKFVVLRGRVIKHDDGSDWWFADTTGSVRLDTDDKELPIGPMLIVTGHIDQARFGIGHLEVDVKHWRFADRQP